MLGVMNVGNTPSCRLKPREDSFCTININGLHVRMTTPRNGKNGYNSTARVPCDVEQVKAEEVVLAVDVADCQVSHSEHGDVAVF